MEKHLWTVSKYISLNKEHKEDKKVNTMGGKKKSPREISSSYAATLNHSRTAVELAAHFKLSLASCLPLITSENRGSLK